MKPMMAGGVQQTLNLRAFSKKNIDRTLFERGNVLKLSSSGPNNKKNHETYDGRGGAANFKFKGLLEISPRTISTIISLTVRGSSSVIVTLILLVSLTLSVTPTDIISYELSIMTIALYLLTIVDM